MDVVDKPRPLRIISGNHHQVEEQLNLLLKEYAALVWNFLEIAGEVRVSVVMVHQSEFRKAQLLQGAGGRV